MPRSDGTSATCSTSWGRPSPLCSRDGPLTTSPRTSSCGSRFVAGPCIVLPGPFQRFAERQRVRLAERRDFSWLVTRIRSGPPPGFFRIGWVRSFPNLNEFFVHHEDVRRANGMDPRTLTPELDVRVCGGTSVEGAATSLVVSVVLGLRSSGQERASDSERVRANPTRGSAGTPGELLLYFFGRQRAAQVEVTGPADAVVAVERTHFGM